MPGSPTSKRRAIVRVGIRLAPGGCEAESRMIRRFIYQWYTCRDRNKPSGRAWARALGISYTWLQKLVRQFRVDPTEMQREMLRHCDPILEQLKRAQEYSRRMRERGELRPSGWRT